MQFSHSDIDTFTATLEQNGLRKLDDYRSELTRVIGESDRTKPEYALAYSQQPSVLEAINEVRQKYIDIKALIVVGIGGSILGTQAVHSVLDKGEVELFTLDVVSAVNIKSLLKKIEKFDSVKDIAICVVSKSGKTTETLVSAGVLFENLEKMFGKSVYSQSIFIGASGTDFLEKGKDLGAETLTMPEIISGRYSVASEVGLVPLALLGHDIESFVKGIADSTTSEYETLAASNSVRTHHYVQNDFVHHNFFVFEPRLYNLGAWYRQLSAESLGKGQDRSGQSVEKGFLPTVSTPTELHSVAQLYFSGFSGVYTDFVTFDEKSIDFEIPESSLANSFSGFSMSDISSAINKGVIDAYEEQSLPYRSTIMGENLSHSLGLFMGMRMLEVMYIAELMDLNAFNQPNVELYKTRTKKRLGL